MKVALLYNQKPDAASPTAAASRYASDEYAEWDNPETIDAVAAALRTHPKVKALVKIDCHPDRALEIVRTLIAERPDLCFNIAEGIGELSREAQMPALCDLLGLRYTASDALTLITTLDKARTKEILAYHHIPTAEFGVIYHEPDIDRVLSEAWIQSGFRAGDSFIIKPVGEGSSKGIFERSVVSTAAEARNQLREALRQYKQPAMMEAFLSGREFTVALLGNDDAVEVLPVVELLFDHLPKDSKKIYSYEAKWLWDEPDNPVEVFRCPAHLTPELRREIERVCREAYRVLRCRDWSRIDVRLDAAGKPHIIEVNPLPGILPNPDEHSCFPMAARTAGMNYDALIHRVLDEALKRYGLSDTD